ncbi:GNAT family N-acetyltransferase [Patescibacteria group bacterium]|nr:GNAT family N-acetyltransferase [Patescibacteria group bacterium]
MFKISLKILHRNLGKKYLSEYKILDQKFRESVEADRGDLAIGEEQLRLGLRVNILVYCKGEPVGFVRLDLRSQPPLIGDLYVEPKFRGKEVVLDQTPWLENESGYKIWQYLIKAAFIIARRAGYKEVGSYIHNESGERLRRWRLIQMPKWELEVGKVDKPSKLLNLIMI